MIFFMNALSRKSDVRLDQDYYENKSSNVYFGSHSLQSLLDVTVYEILKSTVILEEFAGHFFRVQIQFDICTMNTIKCFHHNSA
jgi:hypothetical protein